MKQKIKKNSNWFGLQKLFSGNSSSDDQQKLAEKDAEIRAMKKLLSDRGIERPEFPTDHRYTVHPENTFDYHYDLCRKEYEKDHPKYKTSNRMEDVKIQTKNLFNFNELQDSIFKLNDQDKRLIRDIGAFCQCALEFIAEDKKGNGANHRILDGQMLSNASESYPTKNCNCDKCRWLLFNHNSFNHLFDKLLSKVLPVIEREYFGSYCRPWYVSSLRTMSAGDLTVDNGTAWQWHSDMTFPHDIKMFMYLTDVDEESAPFTYLVDPEGNAVHRPPEYKYISRNKEECKLINPPRKVLSRVPISEINELKSKGYEERQVFMPAGSFFIFDQNYIHKAVPAKNKFRDIIDLRLKPALKKPDSYWFDSRAQTHANDQHEWWDYD